MAIDFVGLKAVYDATLANPQVAMMLWDCGTAQCAIGSFCAANPTDRLKLINSDGVVRLSLDGNRSVASHAIAARFGITVREARLLFVGGHMNNRRFQHVRSAVFLTKEQALARLRKFIYYKMHKQEMITESGRNKQLHLPRNVSGRLSVVAAQGA